MNRLAKALDKGAYAFGYAGQTVTLRFAASTGPVRITNFYIDDVSMRPAH
jgi:hypothetical protein